MSSSPSTISSPFISTSSLPLETHLTDTPSPPFSEHIDDAPLPLPLSKHIEPLPLLPLPLGKRIEPDSPEQEEHFDTPLPPGSPASPLPKRSPSPLSPPQYQTTASVFAWIEWKVLPLTQFQVL
jgi:hypothetical protein